MKKPVKKILRDCIIVNYRSLFQSRGDIESELFDELSSEGIDCAVSSDFTFYDESDHTSYILTKKGQTKKALNKLKNYFLSNNIRASIFQTTPL